MTRPRSFSSTPVVVRRVALCAPLLSLLACAARDDAQGGAELGAAEPRGEIELAQRGEALAVSPTAIGTEPPVAIQYRTGNYLSTASGSSTQLVAFYDGGYIRGMRYDAAGRRLDLDGWLRLGRNDEGTEAYTDLAFGGGVYLVVYSDHAEDAPGIYARALDEAGTLLGEPRLVHPEGGYAGVVFNGTDFTVASYDGDIHLSRVGLDGVPVAGSSVAVTSSGVNNRPVLAMGPSGVGLVVFEQAADGVERKVYAARFDDTGAVLDPGGVLISDATTSSVDVAVAAGSQGFLAVWSAGGSTVHGSVIDAAGTVLLREAPLSRSTASIGGSSVAFDGTDYLVAWEDARMGEAMIYGTRVSEAGVALDASDVALAGPSRAYQSWELDLSWTGSAYALAYAEDGIFGGFFDSSLMPVGPERLELTVVPSAQGVPVAAWDGTHYVLGFSDERDQENIEYNLRSVRLGVDGTIVDPEGVAISDVALPTASGSVASNGEVTLFSWQPMFSEEAYKRVRDADGNLSAPISWRTGGEGAGVVSNGEGFVATFSDGDNGNGNPNQVWGQGFDALGELSGEPFPIVTISRPRGSVSAWAGNYLYAYSGQEVDGTVIPGSTLVFDAVGNVSAEYGPVLDGMLSASSGGNDEQVLFAWQDDAEALWARLLHAVDGFGEPFPLVAGITEGPPAIAWDGTAFVVVYADDRMAMWTLEVSSDGAVSTPEHLFDGDYGFPLLTRGPDGQLLLSYLHWYEFSRTRRVESRFLGDVVPPPADVPLGDPVSPTPEPVATEEPMPDDPLAVPTAVPVVPVPDELSGESPPVVLEPVAGGETGNVPAEDAAPGLGDDAEASEDSEALAATEANEDSPPEETSLERVTDGPSSDGGSCSLAAARRGGPSLPARGWASVTLLTLGLLGLVRRRTFF